MNLTLTSLAVKSGLLVLGMLLFVFSALLVYKSKEKAMNNISSYAVALGIICIVITQLITETESPNDKIRSFAEATPGIAIVIIFIFIGLSEYILSRKICKNSCGLGKNAVKESMDNLPEAVCFSKKDGTPLLVNRSMHRLSHALTGKTIYNIKVLEKNIKEKTLLPDALVIRTEPSVVIRIKEEVWNLRRIEHQHADETLAHNITDQWNLIEEIKSKNDKLEQINEGLRAYQKKVNEYIREKEILNAKIQVHDDIGRSLIAFRSYLQEENKGEKEREELIALWKQNTALLMGEAKRDANIGAWEQLTKAAQSIGVSLNVVGNIPKDERILIILTDSVHECLNNAVLHADASVIDLLIKDDGENIIFEITNNGSVPETEVEEKGGIKNIRRQIELHGGSMEIQSFPEFCLRVSLAKGESHEL